MVAHPFREGDRISVTTNEGYRSEGVVAVVQPVKFSAHRRLTVRRDDGTYFNTYDDGVDDIRLLGAGEVHGRN